MPEANVNGVNINYDIWGAGEPLVLIMGVGANMMGWYPQIPPLSRHFQVIALDNRGAGRSDRPEEYSIPLFVEDTASLLKTLGIDSAHFFGYSMGGMIAQELALTHPEMVRSLILGATTPCMSAWPPTATGMPGQVASMEPAEIFEATLCMAFSDRYIVDHKDELLLNFQIEQPLKAPPQIWQKHLLAALRFDSRDRLSAITAPTLVLAGDDDPVILLDGPKYLAENIPNARLLALPGGRHCFNVEFAEQCNNAIIEFLTSSR